MTNQRMTDLQDKLAAVIGAPVEITIRGERKFTFSLPHVDQDLEFHLVQFFGPLMTVDSAEIDNECGTFVYMTAA